MTKKIIDAILYIVVFLVVQVFVEIVTRLIFHVETADATATVVKAIVSSIITIAVFAWLRWSPFSRRYLQSHPWDVVLWTALLAVGTVLPSAFLQEHLGMELPPEYEQIFLRLMNHPLGYLAVGILVPVAEEMVFRGAILRTLLHNGNRSTVQPSLLFWSRLCSSGPVTATCHSFSMPRSSACCWVGCIGAQAASCPASCSIG